MNSVWNIAYPWKLAGALFQEEVDYLVDLQLSTIRYASVSKVMGRSPQYRYVVTARIRKQGPNELFSETHGANPQVRVDAILGKPFTGAIPEIEVGSIGPESFWCPMKIARKLNQFGQMNI